MPCNQLIGRICGLALALILTLPLYLSAQTPSVLASEIRVTPEEAVLSLELLDNTTVSISLRGGQVFRDGNRLGSFTPGGELDRAWRDLLAQALSADAEALASLLGPWTPPTTLSGDEAVSAEALKQALVLLVAQEPETPQEQRPLPDASLPSGQAALVAFLLENPEASARIQRLIDRDPGALQWWVGGERDIPEGTRLEGSLAVLGGNLELGGVLGGDLLMFEGDVRLGSNAQIEGDLRIDGGLIRGSTQGVQGRVQRMAREQPQDRSGATVDDVDPSPSFRSEFQRGFEAGADLRRAARQTGPFHEFFTGLGNLLRTGVSFVILMGLGLGALYFFPRPFEVVTRTCQASFWRSLGVGWAALVVSPFVWITVLLLLTVTIIGIPVALLWIFVFWMALALAILFGTLAVSRVIGAWWVGRSGLPIPRRMDPEKPAVQLGLGTAVLLASAAASALFQMGGGLFEIFRILSAVVGGILVANVMAAGLGAFLLSRAGRDGRWTNGLDDLAVDLDDDLFTAEPPISRD